MTSLAFHAIADLDVAGGVREWHRVIDALRTLPLCLHIRAKNANTSVRTAAATRALGNAAVVILNGTPTEAVDAGVHGAHIPESIMNSSINERGALTWLGASVHGESSALLAAQRGCDYVMFAPVFDARSKAAPGRGVPALRDVVERTPLNVIALGGITPINAPVVLDAGARGIASLAPLHQHTDPQRIARSYLDALASYRKERHDHQAVCR